MVDLESRGLAGVIIASDPFRQAAGVQSAALGADPAVVFVPHPIQDRTDGEMKQAARDAMPAILSQLVEKPNT